MKKSLILILSMFLLIPLVFAQDIPVGVINSSLEVYGLGDMPMSCYIGFCNVSPENLSFDYVGDVMLVGHVNQSLDLGSMLCCGKGFSYAKKYHGFDYGANFFVSSSGHFWNESLGEEFELGSGRDLVDLNINTGSCSTEVFVDNASQNYGCAVSEEPVFRVSSSFNAHVGRLNGTVEGGFGGHAFKYVTCCDKLELCWDGLDNDLDGDIDCADPDCYGSAIDPQPPSVLAGKYGSEPQLCTGSPYDTNGCALSGTQGVVNPLCQGPDDAEGADQFFYCSYGLQDEFNFTDGSEKTVDNESLVGICCPVGTRSEYDKITGKWKCQERDECGVRPDFICKFSFQENNNLANSAWFDKASWLASTNTPMNFCNTPNPVVYTPEELLPYWPDRSTGCCLIDKFGKSDYWFDKDNIKIFGYHEPDD